MKDTIINTVRNSNVAFTNKLSEEEVLELAWEVINALNDLRREKEQEPNPLFHARKQIKDILMNSQVGLSYALYEGKTPDNYKEYQQLKKDLAIVENLIDLI